MNKIRTGDEVIVIAHEADIAQARRREAGDRAEGGRCAREACRARSQRRALAFVRRRLSSERATSRASCA